MGESARIAKRSFIIAAACVTCVLVTSGPSSRAASSGSVTVLATIASATNLSTASCATGTPNVTDFGFLVAGTSNLTSTDCSVVFGSSNNTAMLRVYQRDLRSAAMQHVSWAQDSSGPIGTDHLDAIDISTIWGQRAGANSTLTRTINGGTSWSTYTATGFVLNAISAVDSQTAWAVGDGGAILKSTDGNVSWNAQVSGTANNLNGVAAVDASTAYAVGDSGTVLKTTDGGANWASVAPAGYTNHFDAIEAVDANTVWIGGQTTGGANTFRTINGGSSWNASTSAGGYWVCCLSAVSATEAWTTGGYIWSHSTTGGAPWTNKSDPAIPSGSNIDSIETYGSQNIWVGGNNGTLLHSSNGGTSFQVETESMSCCIETIAAVDETYAFSFDSWLVRRPAPGAADFVAATTDWSVGTNMFGACLRSVTGGASSGVANGAWIADAETAGDEAAVSADCADGNSDPWNKIAATSGTAGSKIAASLSAGTTTAQANIRFGFRTSATQAAGSYVAPLVYEVIAPNV